MPNTKEKLIEKINTKLMALPYGEITLNTAEEIADSLIEDGYVTDTNVGKWISVKDRLPEKECRCLVCTKGEYGSGVDIAGYCIEPTPKGIFYPDEMVSGFVIDLRTTHGVCVAINEIVTHWMPLPEPPLDATE